MARKYSIWNATIASLQFWIEDLDPVTLGRATECVYTTFFYSSTSHTLHQQSNETLFGCFVIALNAAFGQQLLLADEGYKNGSYTINLPTPLQKTPCIHHVNTLHLIQFSPHHAVHHKLHPDQCADAYPLVQQTSTLQTAPQYAQTAQMMKKISRWHFGWWTLDFWRNTWKNFMYSWTWSNTWIMPVPMPLHKLWNYFLHGQFGFKWHFRLWGLYGYIQWWGDTRNGGSTILI